MSLGETIASLGRRFIGRLFAYVREFALVTAYVAVSTAIVLPTILGTGVAIFWLNGRLGLTGHVRTAYFAVGVVVLMVVFSKVRTVVLGLSRLMLGPTRNMAIN